MNESTDPRTAGSAGDFAQSVNQWRAILGEPRRTLLCPPCDVSWRSDGDDPCWCCGEDGIPVLSLYAQISRARLAS